MIPAASRYLNYMYSYPHKTAYRKFTQPVPIAPFFETLTNKEGELYFHIPFCTGKCGFCNLFSSAKYNQEMLTTYLKTVHRQAEQLSEMSADIKFTSLAIGGGTPLVVDEKQFDMLMTTAGMFGITSGTIPFSVETSPEFSSLTMLKHLRAYGVSRLSIGIQSFNNTELNCIRRSAKADLCRSALENIKKAGFPDLNIDLIYGIKNQSVDSFKKSLLTALEYQPTELFLYPLYVREGTGINSNATDDDYLAMYEMACNELLSRGFTQTSMRRFARKTAYEQEFSCGDELMISCGCGGRGYIGDLHYSSLYSVRPQHIYEIINSYIKATDFTKAVNGYILNSDEKMRRFIIKNLMYYRGIDKNEFLRRFGISLPYNIFEHLIAEGYVSDSTDFIRLTAKGMSLSDYIGQLFISDEVRKKMETQY